MLTGNAKVHYSEQKVLLETLFNNNNNNNLAGVKGVFSCDRRDFVRSWLG